MRDKLEDGPMMEMNRWTAEGIRAAMEEGERELDTDRWGVGLPFRIQAIACCVALYDAIWENPGKKKEEVIRLAAKDATVRLKELGIPTMMLINKQLCIDMWRSMKTVVKEDKAGMEVSE